MKSKSSITFRGSAARAAFEGLTGTKISTRVKSVGWAYPSSDSAKKFGRSREGCWVLQTGYAGEPLTAISGHDNRESALGNARQLSNVAWDAAFVSTHPEDAK